MSQRNQYEFVPLTFDEEPNGLQWIEVRSSRDHGRKPRNRCEAAILKVTS